MVNLSTDIISLIDLSLGFEEKAKGKGRGHWGHKGRPGKRGGSAPSKGRGLSNLPKKNLDAIQLDKGSLWGATEGGRPVSKFLYSPRSGKLIAGSGNHVAIKNKYGDPSEPYDDLIKMWAPDYFPGMKPVFTVHVDRHRSVSEADAWNKSLRAAGAMRAAGFPGNTTVRLVRTSELGAIRLPLGEI